MEQEQTYILDNEEVKLTGRTATRSKGTFPFQTVQVQELVEVTPIDSNVGTWKRWVLPSTLFKININDK